MDARDILFLTLAIAITVVTGMTVWVFVYTVRIFRSLSGIIDDFRQRLATIDDILRTIKDKLTSTHLELSALVLTVKQLLGWFMDRRAKRRSSTRPA